MVRDATAKVEDVGGNGDYQRFYAQADLVSDSAWPFRTGQRVRMQVVETTCDRRAVVVVPAALEVVEDVTDLAIERTTNQPEQETLDELAEGS